MSFHEMPFRARLGAMGDEAEGIFEKVETGWVRIGLRRPPFPIHMLPIKLRYTPDYLQPHRFAEVQGFGRDGLVRIKVEKLFALSLWSHDHPTELWLWDKPNRRYGSLPVPDVMNVVCLAGEGDRYEDNGREYWKLPADVLPVEWTEVAP